MDWATTAIISAAAMAVVNIVDSHLITKRMPSFRAFLLPVGVMHMFSALLIFFIFPFPENAGIVPVLAAIASGILRTSAVIIMLYQLKQSEVSEVIPIVYTSPIFVAMLAAPLLGESLSLLRWVAILTVVTGAVLVSVRRTPLGATNWHHRVFFLLLVSSLLFALGDIASKYALQYISFWNGYSLAAFCLAGTFLIMSLSGPVWREVRDMSRRNSSLGILACNELLAQAGIILSFWAIQRGPVSLVSTIIGSRPVFVVLFSLALGQAFPRFLVRITSWRMLLVRLGGTLLIFGGIALIYLT